VIDLQQRINGLEERLKMLLAERAKTEQSYHVITGHMNEVQLNIDELKRELLTKEASEQESCVNGEIVEN